MSNLFGNVSKPSSVCRICLVCEGRMFTIAGTPLQQVYEKITNTILNITDLKPVTACYICYAHLNNCYKLIRKSNHAENVLTSISETYPMVTNKLIAMNDLQANLCSPLKTRTVEYFDIPTCFDPIMDEEPVFIDPVAPKKDPLMIKELTCIDPVIAKEGLDNLSIEVKVKRETEGVSGKSESTAVCRICLAVDVRMFIIADTPLQFVYEKITGNLLCTADSRSTVACYICHAQLEKSRKLMLMSSKADKLLTAIVKDHSEVKTSLPATIDWNSDISFQTSLTTRPVECYDSLTPAGPTVPEVTVTIEVEPDVYVGSPPPDTSDVEHVQNSDTEVCKNGDVGKRAKRTCVQQRAVCGGTETETKEVGVTKQPKSVKRKRTKKLVENPNEKQEKCQEKKEKPQRVYKKRIRAYIHECDICKRLFNRTNHLKDHMKTHTDDRPFECTICQRRFIQKINLKNHMMTHTGEKPFECEICHTGFIAKSDFKRHLNTHNEERLFECQLCQRRFTQMPYLKAHISTHTNEKPYECHICHRQFSQKPYLKNHLKRHPEYKRADSNS